MIITVSGPGRRRGLFFWVVVSLSSLLLINLLLYFTVYGDSATGATLPGNVVDSRAGQNSGQSGSAVSPQAEIEYDQDTVADKNSVWDSANDFISSVTGGYTGKTVAEGGSAAPLADNKRNKRLRSFLPKSFYADSQLILDEPALQQFDRRLLPALWVHSINKQLKSGAAFLPSDFKLPFNWDLLNNYLEKIQQLKYFDTVVKGKMTCAQFRDIAPKNLPLTFLENFCVNFNSEEPNFVNDYNVPFLITRKIDQYLTDVDWRKLYGMLYSLTNSPIPENVLFLGGIGPEDRSLLVPLEKVSNGKNNLASLGDQELSSYYTKMAQEYVEDQKLVLGAKDDLEVVKRGISVYEEWVRLNELLLEREVVPVEESELVYFPSKPMVLGRSVSETSLKLVELNLDDFKFFLPDEELKLDKLIKEAPEGANTKQLENLKLWADLVLDPEWEEPWYYGIPSIEGEHLDHYDWRFFSVFTLKEDPELHTAILHRLSRVWFRICAKFNVASWMNHGPLIGWYWSGTTLPYDFDLDLQMPIQLLHRISKFLNNTLVYDFANEEEYINDAVRIDNRAELGIRSYLIDIDPLYFDRNQVRTLHNDLDLRLIDTETGIYIDLTLISEFHSGNRYDLDEQKRYFEKSNHNGYRITVPTHWNEFQDENGYKVDRGRANEMKDGFVKKIEEFVLAKKTKDSRLEGSPTLFLTGYLHDKHFHTYKLSELSPLIPTFYENSVSYMPSNWKKNTLIEYQGGRCLTNSYYEKHHFLNKLMLWVGHKDCPIWDEKTGDFNDGMSENQVSNECLLRSAKLEGQYRRSVHYLNLHNIYRDKLLKDQGDVMKLDNFDKEIAPLLDKFDGNLFVPEPFVERYLY